MKRELILDIDGQEISLTAKRDGESIVVERDGTSYTVRIVAESVVGLQTAASHPTGSRPSAVSGAANAPGRTPAASSPSGAGLVGTGAVVAPMTGVIDQVIVAEGDSISEGDKVVILEAMKMYIDVVAPATGTVRSVSVKPGDSVKEGTPLVVIE